MIAGPTHALIGVVLLRIEWSRTRIFIVWRTSSISFACICSWSAILPDEHNNGAYLSRYLLFPVHTSLLSLLLGIYCVSRRRLLLIVYVHFIVVRVIPVSTGIYGGQRVVGGGEIPCGKFASRCAFGFGLVFCLVWCTPSAISNQLTKRGKLAGQVPFLFSAAPARGGCCKGSSCYYMTGKGTPRY